MPFLLLRIVVRIARQNWHFEVGQILVVNGVEEKLLGPGLYGHMLIVRRPVDVVLAELAIPRVLVRQ